MSEKIDTQVEKQLSFEDNQLFSSLLGYQSQHMRRLEKLFDVSIASRGTQILIKGKAPNIDLTEMSLITLYDKLERNLEVNMTEIESTARTLNTMTETNKTNIQKNILKLETCQIITRKKTITPRSTAQYNYIKALLNHELVFCIGPAGTGKTYLAVANAVANLLSGHVNKIILSRPAIEAGEHLGFLPGDIKEKIDPYMRPLYDALYDMLPANQIEKYLEAGTIEIAPLAYMRGRTLSDAFIILDEAQNTTSVQMKMFLTRLGDNSKMAVIGDISQIDLQPGKISGLVEASQRLNTVSEIQFSYFTKVDVVRHHLVSKIIEAYEKPLSSASFRKS